MSELLNSGKVDYPKSGKRVLLVESISKNNFLRKQIIMKKWNSSRLLDKFDNFTKANVARLYQSRALMLIREGVIK